MICIYCGNTKTSVTNSRPNKKRPAVWRRRQCDQCSTAFTTMETIDSSAQLTVYVPGSGGQPFSIPRLLLSLSSVLSHRPEQADDAYWLAQTVAEHLYSPGTVSELTPGRIALVAYEVLDRYDPTAALQYGARYGIVTSSKRRRAIRRRGNEA